MAALSLYFYFVGSFKRYAAENDYAATIFKRRRSGERLNRPFVRQKFVVRTKDACCAADLGGYKQSVILYLR